MQYFAVFWVFECMLRKIPAIMITVSIITCDWWRRTMIHILMMLLISIHVFRHSLWAVWETIRAVFWRTEEFCADIAPVFQQSVYLSSRDCGGQSALAKDLTQVNHFWKRLTTFCKIGSPKTDIFLISYYGPKFAEQHTALVTIKLDQDDSWLIYIGN